MRRILANVAIMMFIVYIQNDFVDIKNSFYILENRIKDSCEFIENGVRSESIVLDSKDECKNSILKKIEKEYEIDAVVDNDRIFAINEDINIEVNIYSIYSTTYMDINLINYDENSNISKLMKEINKLQSDKTYKVKYYKYIKGKINKDEDILDKINKDKILKNLEILDIHNGYVGTAYLLYGVKVNLVKSSYNSGSYFMIGSPILFTTY